MGDIGTIYAKIGADVSDLKRADTAVKGFTSSFGSHMKTATAAIFSWQAAVASVIASISFGKVIADAKEYSSAIVDMGKVTTASASSIRKDIESIDAALGSSTQLMKGYYEVLSSGYKPGVQGLELLTTAAKSSKAAHVDQATTILALTKMMAGYAGQLKSATEASDLLFKIEEIGITKFQELVPIIGSVSNVSRIAGLSAKEMGGALALITQTAGSTSEAATELEAMLTALIKPTDEMTDLFAEFGGVSKAIAKTGLVEVLKKIEGAASGSTEALAALLGGRKEALIGFASLAVNNFGTVARYIGEMDKASGVSEKNWKAFEASFEGVMDKFWNTLSNTLAKAGMEVLPMLAEEFEHLANWIKANEKTFITIFKDISSSVGILADAIRILWNALAAVPNAFLSFMERYSTNVNKAAQETRALKEATDAYIGSTTKIAQQKSSWEVLIGEIVWLGKETWTSIKTIGDGALYLLKTFTTIISAIGSLFLEMFTAVGKELAYLASPLQWDKLGSSIGPFLKNVQTIAKTTFEELKQNYKELDDAIMKNVTGTNASIEQQKEYAKLAREDVELTNARAAAWKKYRDTMVSASDDVYNEASRFAHLMSKTSFVPSDDVGTKKMGKEMLDQYKSILADISKLTKSAYAARIDEIEAAYDKEMTVAKGNLEFVAAAEAHKKASYAKLAEDRAEISRSIEAVEKKATLSALDYEKWAIDSEYEAKVKGAKNDKLLLDKALADKELAIKEHTSKIAEIQARAISKITLSYDYLGDVIRGSLSPEQADRALKYSVEKANELAAAIAKIPDMDTRIAITMEAIEHGIEAALKKANDLGKVVGELSDEVNKEALKKAKEASDAIEKTWDNMIKNTQEKLGDVVYDAMSGNIESWDDLLDTLKDMFKRWLAEIIAYAAMKQIVIPILMETDGFGGLINIPKSALDLYGGGGGSSIFSTLIGKLGKELGLDDYFDKLGSEIWSGISSLFSTPSGASAYLGDMYAGMSAEAMADLGAELAAMGSTAATTTEGVMAVSEAMALLGESSAGATAAGAGAAGAGAGTGFLATAAAAAPYVAILLAVPIVLRALGTAWHKLVSGSSYKTAGLSVSSNTPMALTPGAATPNVSATAWGAHDVKVGGMFSEGLQSDVDESIREILLGAQKHITDLVRALPPALSDLMVKELSKASINLGWDRYEGDTRWQRLIITYSEYIAAQVNSAINIAMKSAMDKFVTPTWEDLSGSFSKLAVVGKSDFGMDAFISKAEVLKTIGEKIDAFDYAGALTYYHDVLVFTSQLVAAGDEMGFVTEKFVKSVHDLVATGDLTKAAEQVRTMRDFVDTLLVAVQPTKQFDIALRTLAEEFGIIALKADELGVSLTLVTKAQEKQTEALLKQKDAYIKSLVGLDEKGFISGSIGDALEAVGNLFKDWKDWFEDVNDAAESLMGAKSKLYYAMGGVKEKFKVGDETFNLSDRMKAYTSEGEEVEPVLKKVMGKWIKTFRPVMDLIDYFSLAGDAITKVVDKVYTSADYSKLATLKKWAADYKIAAESMLAPSTVGGEFVNADAWFAEHPKIPLPELPYNEIEDWFVAYDAFGKKIEPIVDAAGKRTFKGLESTIAYFEMIDTTVKTSEEIAPTKEDLDTLDAVNKWLKAVREGTATLEDLIKLTPMKMEDFTGAIEEFVDAFDIASLGSGAADFIKILGQTNQAIEDITVTFGTLEYMAGETATGVVNELREMSKDALDAAKKFRKSVIDDFFAPVQEIVDKDTLGELGFAMKGLNEWYADQMKIYKELESLDLMSADEMKGKYALLDQAFGILLDNMLDEYIGPINEALDEGANTSGSAYITALQAINDWYTTTGLAIAELYATLDPEKFEEFMDRLDRAYTTRITKLAKESLVDIGEDIGSKTPSVGLPYTTGMDAITKWFADTSKSIFDILQKTTDPALIKEAGDLLKAARESYLTQVDVFRQEIKESFAGVMDPILDIINGGQMNEYGVAMKDLNEWYQKNLLAIYEYSDWLSQVKGDTYDLGTALGILDQAMRVQVKSLISGIMDPVYDIIDQGTLSDYEYQMKKLNLWYVVTVANITALLAGVDPSILADMGITLEEFILAIKEAFDIQVAALDKTTQAVTAVARSFDSISKSTIRNFAELGKALRSLSMDIRDSDPEIAAAARENAKALIEDYLTPFTKDIERFIDSLQTSELAPVQSAEMFKSKYEDLLSKALSGDTQALSDLQSFVESEYLPFLQTFSAATGDYNTVFQGVLDDLNSISAAAVASVKNIDVGRTMQALIEEVLKGMGLVATPPPSITIYTTGVNLMNSYPSGSANPEAVGYAQSGGYYSSMTNLMVGEKGPEFVVPTYEPERGEFLRSVGVDVGQISEDLVSKYSEMNQNSNLESKYTDLEEQLSGIAQYVDTRGGGSVGLVPEDLGKIYTEMSQNLSGLESKFTDLKGQLSIRDQYADLNRQVSIRDAFAAMSRQVSIRESYDEMGDKVSGGGEATMTERQPIYLTVDGKVIAAVIVEQGRKNGQYIRSIRRLSKHGRKRAL